MAKVVKCPACGEATGGPRCACGAEFLTGAIDQVRDQGASDRDQAASDRDQTTSDQDQTWSDHDQTASERDQRSADEDQHAADDDFAAGGGAVTYHPSALARGGWGRGRDAGWVLCAERGAARGGTGGGRE